MSEQEVNVPNRRKEDNHFNAYYTKKIAKALHYMELGDYLKAYTALIGTIEVCEVCHKALTMDHVCEKE